MVNQFLWLVNGSYYGKLLTIQVRIEGLASGREYYTRDIVVFPNLYPDENWGTKLKTELNNTGKYILAPPFL